MANKKYPLEIFTRHYLKSHHGVTNKNGSNHPIAQTRKRKRGGKQRKNRHGKQRRDRTHARKARLELESRLAEAGSGDTKFAAGKKNESLFPPTAKASPDDWSVAREQTGLLAKAKKSEGKEKLKLNLLVTKKNKAARKVKIAYINENGMASSSSSSSSESLGAVNNPDGGREDVWILSRSAQRELWLQWWPKIKPVALEALVEEKPKFSTADSHTSVALRLVTLRHHVGNGDLRALLMKSALLHMRIVEKIHANAQLEKQKKLSGEDAEDPARLEVEELVLEVSIQDMEALGLPGKELPKEVAAERLERPSLNHEPQPHYNPFDDFTDQTWIESESRRILAWARHPPKNGQEAMEDFVAENDTLKTPTSHALLVIRLMKVRDLVYEADMKALLLKTASSHLRIVRYMHR